MQFSFYIARRYLFSKKSHQVINIISGIALAGIALATLAMVCTLSVFNGFQEVVEKQFTALDPDIKIISKKGKSFSSSEERIAKILTMPEIETATFSFEDRAIAQYGEKQAVVTLKGVEKGFKQLTSIENAIYGNKNFILSDENFSYALLGGGVMKELNCGIYFIDPLKINAPRRGKKVNLTNPTANFKKGTLHSSGAIFALNQPKYDNSYIITDINFARDIFSRDSSDVTSCEIKAVPSCNIEKLKGGIAKILGDDFDVQNRYEQQEDVYKVMRIEKLISYIFLAFILLIACFNIIGALSMVIIDKKKDMETLRSLGADDRTITNIFIYEGWTVSAVGAVVGIVLGLSLCLLQQEFGLLSLGSGNNFVVDSYPVRVEALDIVTTFITVLVVGILAVGIPAKHITRRLL